MSDDKGKDYVLGRLVLDYIRAFMWPLVAVVVVVIYQDDVRRILAEREVDIFGLRIGEKVEQIESQAMAEIEDIRLLLEAQQQTAEAGGTPAPQVAEDLTTKLASLERNLSREIARVQSEQPTQTAPVGRAQPNLDDVVTASLRATQAQAAERRGFEALIDHDVDAAIAAFEEARGIWPDYHNVAEISRALKKRRDALASPSAESWSELYRDILARYSWGLPDDLRASIRREVAQAY